LSGLSSPNKSEATKQHTAVGKNIRLFIYTNSEISFVHILLEMVKKRIKNTGTTYT
jgi:hypothetical protein